MDDQQRRQFLNRTADHMLEEDVAKTVAIAALAILSKLDDLEAQLSDISGNMFMSSGEIPDS